MKITARIIASGDHWSVEFPKVDAEECFPIIDGKHVAQPDAVKKILDQKGVTHAKDDTSFLQCVAAQIIAKLNEWKDNNEIGTDAVGRERSIERMSRRVVNGQVTFARAIFRNHWEGERLIVSFDCESDDRGVVEKKRYEKLWMWLMSEAAHIASEECVDSGYPPIAFSERAEAAYADLLAWRKEERHRRVIRWGNERRLMCRCRCASGHCSPCHPKCRFFERGMCVEDKYS